MKLSDLLRKHNLLAEFIITEKGSGYSKEQPIISAFTWDNTHIDYDIWLTAHIEWNTLDESERDNDLWKD